ncbi:hypothetical protein N7456_007381 [Penicillium angulare]|uniref:chitinase n=1 Tax=Penicillium angulare TaxID=116970 RepID=A0A9W9K8D0_9EURO|nr:hypothetical protein N7456_007381 [Penicillium angulare]
MYAAVNGDFVSNCGSPKRETCSSIWEKRRVAYYETWADTKECDSFRPEDIPVKAITHLNIAFGGIKDSRVTIDSSEMIQRIVKLKRKNRSLKVILAVGGWAFSDPGSTRTAWSDMASTEDTRSKFIKSVMNLLDTYDVDGIDLDWEYPVADDRGGKDADYKNYVSLLKEMRSSFDDHNPAWTISIAIPASYWYLQHFDVAGLEPNVDWFNLMSYDMRGKWDQENEWTGPYVFGHTNITEIENGVDLLRRNDIDLSKVNLGMGFYGRTFTLADKKCFEPGCVFSDAGVRGECSGEEGILTFKEIMARQHRLNEKTIRYDEESGVKYMIYDENQWITYDDDESFKKKREMLDSECFGGVMIWAIDQDTSDFQALTGLLGDKYVSGTLMEGGDLSDEEKEALVDEMGGLTGDKCYVTTGCVGGKATIEGNSKCNAGDVTVGYVHSPGEAAFDLYGFLAHNSQACAKGTYKRICCPAKAPAINCKWEGAPSGDSTKCTGGEAENTCGGGKYELFTDRYTDADGGTKCSGDSKRSLCCDAPPEMQKCHWTSCTVFRTCGSSSPQPITIRGDFCEDGDFQNFCCEKDAELENCDWVPDLEKKDGNLLTFPDAEECSKRSCPSTKFTAAKAILPGRGSDGFAPCGFNGGGGILQHRLCCDPKADLDLPFDLKKIFPDPIGEDVAYQYSDNYGNNDDDPHGPDETDMGDDPYGFIVLDGDEDALQGEFPSDFAFTHVEDGSGATIQKRELLTRDDPELMNWVFEHEESSHLVYCRKGREAACEKVFKGGAPDTIISLPRHIGSGPYARILSMEPVGETDLTDFHIRKRALEQHDSVVYNLTIDYRFELIRREDSTVNVRIDYTNLVPYWDEMTGSDSDSGKTKRELRHEKRWWGGYPDWLKRLTAVRNSDKGRLPMSIHKKMLLYSRRSQCTRGNVNLKAGLDVTLDAKFDMNARWAYYAEGTIVPMSIDTVYTYFELEPEVQAVIEIEGSAEMKYASPRLRIIDTLSYPGLAIKGIAAVGPTLDLWGGMEAGARVAGKLTAGAKVTFPKYEMYFPQIDEADDFQKFAAPDSEDEHKSEGTDMVPILDASVEARVNIDFKITPEVNLGIKVNAPIKKGGTIVDSQIVGFVNNTLRFEVEAQAKAGIDNPPAATYSVYIKYFYNFGLGGRAVFKWLGDYALKPRTLFGGLGRQKILWEHHGSASLSKRNPLLAEEDGADKFIPIYNTTFVAEDDWLDSTGIFPHQLSKRSTLEDVASFNANNSFFTCNDGGQCASGACTGGSCEWKPANSKSKSKRADDDDGDPMDVDASQNCISSIPAMMYNCKFFPDQTAGGRSYPGICHNIINYFSAQGLGAGPFSGNYGEKGGGETTNRKWVCGTLSKHKYTLMDENDKPVEYDSQWAKKCDYMSQILGKLTGKGSNDAGNENWLSCDEFPFNSLEEGGNPVSNSRSCVPGYQQAIQSTVNGLPRQMQQEVSWEGKDGTTKTAWKDWTADWGGPTAVGRRNDPDKDTAWNLARNHHKSFTFHLFNSDSTTEPTGSAYEVFNHKLSQSEGEKHNMDQVVGAFNLMGSSKHRVKTHNAICVNPDKIGDHDYWGKYIRGKGCTVVFDNTVANAKRSRGEEPTQEELFNITSVEVPEDGEEFVIDLSLY